MNENNVERGRSGAMCWRFDYGSEADLTGVGRRGILDRTRSLFPLPRKFEGFLRGAFSSVRSKKKAIPYDNICYRSMGTAQYDSCCDVTSGIYQHCECAHAVPPQNNGACLHGNLIPNLGKPWPIKYSGLESDQP